MLLSPTDRIRFKILYMDHSHKELAVIFNSTTDRVIEQAKVLGVYDSKRRDKDEVFKKLWSSPDENLTNL